MKKLPLVNIIISALLALLTVVIGLLSSVVTTALPPTITPYLRYTLPLLGVVTLAFIGLTVWQTWRQSLGDDGVLPKSEHYRQSVEKQRRKRMIEKMRSYWIKGVLEQSLHGAALIVLELKEQQDADKNAWRFVFQQTDLPEQELPSGTRITQVYDDSGGELLLLGEPGSGKTTLMLELARDLLERASKDDSHPIPVVFNLSSWAVKRLPLTDWRLKS